MSAAEATQMEELLRSTYSRAERVDHELHSFKAQLRLNLYAFRLARDPEIMSFSGEVAGAPAHEVLAPLYRR